MKPTDKERVAWTRFCNGLKISAAERHLILGMVRNLRDRLQQAEQKQYDAEVMLRMVRDYGFGCTHHLEKKDEDVDSK